MPDASTISAPCSACGAKLRTPAANAGKQLSCPRCQSAVLVPVAPTTTPARRPSEPCRRGPDVWTGPDRFWVRFGISLMIFGVLGHVLPLVGLQFTKLAKLGAGAPTAATWIFAIGAFMIVYVLVLKGRLLRIIVGAAALVVLGFVSLLIIGYLNRPSFPSSRGPAPGFEPSGVGGPMGPGFVPPGLPRLPAPPQHARADYPSLVERFGAAHVVRVSFNGHEGVDLFATIRERIAGWDPNPAAWSVSTQGNNAELVMGPVDDFQQLGARLNMGSVTGVDEAERRLIVSVDKDKCVPKK